MNQLKKIKTVKNLGKIYKITTISLMEVSSLYD